MQFNTPTTVLLVAVNHEQHKIERLERVVRITCAIMGVSYEQYCKLISELMDNRGRLEVVWFDTPTEVQRRAFATAWELCGENKNHVEHLIK